MWSAIRGIYLSGPDDDGMYCTLAARTEGVTVADPHDQAREKRCKHRGMLARGDTKVTVLEAHDWPEEDGVSFCEPH